MTIRDTRICEFAPTVVPGLLQTKEYARAVTIAANPFEPDSYVDEIVTARSERSLILDDAARPEYWVTLHENVLRIGVGGPQAMAAQSGHIARLMRDRTAVVTVLPYDAGAHAAMGGMLKLMDFEEAPPVACTETEYSGTLIDDPAVVMHAQRTYDLLRAAALSPEASLALIESAAEAFRRCARST
ncbi:hypothetical protein GCM10010279_03750 [Streptomyces mutabilis]|nr:hypothetical protein GCM10010279_03750 [Streptomyces mutabilis]